MGKIKIDRRQFLLSSTLAAASCATSSGQLGGEPAPNLLIIHTDQQNCWSLGCYGSDLIKTPNIDSLATQGVMCTNHFANSAVCTPSRGTLLTGRYPHSNGAYKNDVALNRNEQTLARILSVQGYNTGYSGKWHLDGKPKPGWLKRDRAMGFKDCRFMYNRGHWKKIIDRPKRRPQVYTYKTIGDQRSYTTDWLGTKTIDFIRENKNNPFFYMVSIPDPHSPYTVRPPYDSRFDPAKMPVARTLFQTDKPAWAAGKPIKKENHNRRKRLFQKRTANYLGMVQCIDDTVGRILNTLRAEKLLEQTIVVFTTDHGDYMGEHGLIGKNNIYETAYRIPFLIRWPRKLPTGGVMDRCWANVDFLPTMLSLLGLEIPANVQGQDAARLLNCEKQPWVDEAFLHHPSFNKVGIFTPDYELALVKDSDHVLFDRHHDPDQVNNLFNNPEKRPLIIKLLDRIVAHHKEFDSPAHGWLTKLQKHIGA